MFLTCPVCKTEAERHMMHEFTNSCSCGLLRHDHFWGILIFSDGKNFSFERNSFSNKTRVLIRDARGLMVRYNTDDSGIINFLNECIKVLILKEVLNK